MIDGYYYFTFTQNEIDLKTKTEKFLISKKTKILLSEDWVKNPDCLKNIINSKQLSKYPKSILVNHSYLMHLKNENVEYILEHFQKLIIQFDQSTIELSGHFLKLLNYKDKVDFVYYIDSNRIEKKLFIFFPHWIFNSLHFRFDSKKLKSSQIYKIIRKLKNECHFEKVKNLAGLHFYDSRIEQQVEVNPLPKLDLSCSTEQKNINFSFIIPFYNNSHFAINCLQHLLKQYSARSEFEVIIINDGSDDWHLQKILEFLAPEHKTINLKIYSLEHKKITKNHIGSFRAGYCRHIGVFYSQGEIISFLDSDMLVPADYIEKIKNDLSSYDIVQFVRKHIYPQFSSTYCAYENISSEKVFIEEARYWGQLFNSNVWQDIYDYWKYTCTYSLSMTKESYFQIGGFLPLYVSYGFEDTDFGYSAHLLNKKFYLNKTPLYHLTDFAEKARYHHSIMFKHQLLKITSKTFFLNHLNEEIYEKFSSLMD